MFRGCVSQAALARTAACSLRRSTLRTTSRIRTPTAIPFSSTASASQLYRNNGPAEPEPHVPLSLQALYFKPLRREETHGLPVCNLQLRSFSVRQLEAQADFALRAAYYLNLPAGIATLPKKIERWTVPRSNFVHKKSQENFERITRSRVIQIKDGHPETVELWLAFIKKHAYYGVGLKANLWSFDEIGIGKTMNVSLDTLRDVSRPKWAHFGPGKTVETAAMVREILRGDRYKEKPFPLYPADAPVNQQWDIRGKPIEQSPQQPIEQAVQQPTGYPQKSNTAPESKTAKPADEPWETVDSFKREVQALESEAPTSDEQRFMNIEAEVAEETARRERALRLSAEISESRERKRKEMENKLILEKVQLGGIEHEHHDIQETRAEQVKSGTIAPEVVSAEKQAQLQLQEELRRQMVEMQKEVEAMRARDKEREAELQALRDREMERMKEQMQRDLEAQKAQMQAAMLQMQQEMLKMKNMSAAPAAAPSPAAEPTPAPVAAASEAPATQEAAPQVVFTAAPSPAAEPTPAPVASAAEAPAEPTPAPVAAATEAPAEPTPALVAAATEAPAEPTPAPVAVAAATEAPAEPTPAPVAAATEAPAAQETAPQVVFTPASPEVAAKIVEAANSVHEETIQQILQPEPTHTEAPTTLTPNVTTAEASPQSTQEPAVNIAKIPIPTQTELIATTTIPAIGGISASVEAIISTPEVTPTLTPQEPKSEPEVQSQDKLVEASLETTTDTVDPITGQNPAVAIESLTESIGTLDTPSLPKEEISGEPVAPPQLHFQPEVVVDEEEEVKIPKQEAPEQVKDEDEKNK